MDLLKDKPTATLEDVDLVTYMALDFLRGALRQYSLRVASASPEDHFLSKLCLQAADIHTAAAYLYRIDGIQPGVDEIRKEFPHSSAAVQHDFDVRQLLRPTPHEFVPRLEELTIHCRGNLRTALHAKVVSENNDVDEGTYDTEEVLKVL